MRIDLCLKKPRPGWAAGALLLLTGGLAAVNVSGAEPIAGPAARLLSQKAVDFDREIRPILAENCFACHGFDANQRKAGLRLDTAEGAYAALASGKHAVAPRKPQASALFERVTAQNALKMPPASSGKHVTPEQVATLRRWIEQGGSYSQHWAFVPPQLPAVPAVAKYWPGRRPGTPSTPSTRSTPSTLPGSPRAWVRNPIDAFILARLRKEGLKPSPEADRYTLIRRVTFDLTGLPPTLPEVDAFVQDRSPDAYEKVVDRLLASPQYGERMALKWLDLARYADTHGYHIDSHRDMWPWRNWVIDAFNRNMPFDQFTIEQLAGDLLPNATLAQKVATGFNRNHPINFEGGAIPEEYQTAYVFDRLDTTFTTWTALTMKCAECHDHKYDPLTQKEYYRAFAFFNNIAEKGLDGQKGNAAPFMKAPTPEQARDLETYGKKVASLDAALKTRATEAADAQAEWERKTAVALDDTPVATEGLLARYPLDEATGNRVKDAAGKQPAGTVRIKGEPNYWGQGKFGGALRFDGYVHVDLGSGLAFDREDRFSYGAWIYPTSKEHGAILAHMDPDAAFRGWDLYLGDGNVYVHLIHEWEKNAIRVNTKTPLDLNRWHHVFVTYDGSSKAKGVRVYLDGKPAELAVTHDALTDSIKTDKPAVIGKRDAVSAPFKGLIDEVRVYGRELPPAEIAQLTGFALVRDILAAVPEKRTADQKAALAQYFLENQDDTYRQLQAERVEWQRKLEQLDAAIPTTMVMQELEKPRETHILLRGQYDRPGEQVTPGVPAVLPPLPTDAPPNRLAFARWLVDPSHPLTARVAVNRFWHLLFGAGLVRTVENFGTQGEPPTHPQLIDWLACEFMAGAADGTAGEQGRGAAGEQSGPVSPSPLLPGSVAPRRPWDTKALLRLLVTSATYRQSSRVTPELAHRDPENRLLARGPRFRLPAEFIRDQALTVSGLLVPKIGGPSVKPYHPPGLWEEMAFGGAFTAQKYEQDHGEALYRRSMYTFWKRTCPPPALQTFDAPEREVCMVRRLVTNTPLQALVLLNDPTYVEASRKFAERLMKEAPTSPRDRVVFAFRTCLARPPKEPEIALLLDTYNRQLATFRADRPAAEKLLSVGESPRDDKLDVPELAAWAIVASTILNLDETLTKN